MVMLIDVTTSTINTMTHQLMDSEGFYQASSLVIYNLKIEADAHSCFDMFG